MRYLLLAAALLLATPAHASLWENGWCWDESPGATSYELCWSPDPADWWSAQCLTALPWRDCTAGRCCLDVPCPPPGRLVFFMAVACNEAGCSYLNKNNGRPMRWCP